MVVGDGALICQLFWSVSTRMDSAVMGLLRPVTAVGRPVLSQGLVKDRGWTSGGRYSALTVLPMLPVNHSYWASR
jgi:hypothetical protein